MAQTLPLITPELGSVPQLVKQSTNLMPRIISRRDAQLGGAYLSRHHFPHRISRLGSSLNESQIRVGYIEYVLDAAGIRRCR